MSVSTNLTRPIFIVGPGRSGTTLLRSLLSAHSRIAVTPETHFMARARQWGLSEGAPADFETFWSRYTSWLRFRDLHIDAGRCRELIESEGDYSFQTIFRAVLSVFQEASGKARIGEKTPGHSAFLPILLEWFPDARILFTQRDPRAVIASQLKTYYVKERLTPYSMKQGLIRNKRKQEIIFFARDWVENFEQRLPTWRDDPRFYTVVYEDLVSNTEAEVRAIFEFLGEEFEPEVLEERTSTTVPEPKAWNGDDQMNTWSQEHLARSAATVSTDSLEKWKTELSTAEVAMIEGICAPTMRRLGYSPSLSPRQLSIGKSAATAFASASDAEIRMHEIAAGGRRRAVKANKVARSALGRMADAGVDRGLPPAWFGYRRVHHETVQDWFARHSRDAGGRYETIHPEQIAENPLPCNIDNRDQLPGDRGWWRFSFRDVPRRVSGETFIATLPDCLISWYRAPEQENDFYPAILNDDGRALDLRELQFRPRHAVMLRDSPKPARLGKAVWITERVYHNHSHWLTAHLPKLLLLRERGLLDQVLLPPERTPAIDGSLRMLGLEPDDFLTWDPDRPLQVDELTVLGTDRFRPELLRLVPKAYGIDKAAPPFRKVFISRLQATRRRLLNEEEVWAKLEPRGFERVFMEDMTFSEQVQLMAETATLVAPHGAGLTNMMFCPEGLNIVEIADLNFPNPNFYALASAVGHQYWLIEAESVGDVHPLEKDLRVNPDAIEQVLHRLDSSPESVETAPEMEPVAAAKE